MYKRQSNQYDLVNMFKVRFNASWFVFHHSSWSFLEPYFSRKHLFHESYTVNRTQDYRLKTSKQGQIIRYCHNFENIVIEGFRHHSISLLSKSFSNIVFTEWNIKNCKDQTVNYSNISLFFYLMERHKSNS